MNEKCVICGHVHPNPMTMPMTMEDLRKDLIENAKSKRLGYTGREIDEIRKMPDAELVDQIRELRARERKSASNRGIPSFLGDLEFTLIEILDDGVGNLHSRSSRQQWVEIDVQLAVLQAFKKITDLEKEISDAEMLLDLAKQELAALEFSSRDAQVLLRHRIWEISPENRGREFEVKEENPESSLLHFIMDSGASSLYIAGDHLAEIKDLLIRSRAFVSRSQALQPKMDEWSFAIRHKPELFDPLSRRAINLLELYHPELLPELDSGRVRISKPTRQELPRFMRLELSTSTSEKLTAAEQSLLAALSRIRGEMSYDELAPDAVPESAAVSRAEAEAAAAAKPKPAPRMKAAKAKLTPRKKKAASRLSVNMGR